MNKALVPPHCSFQRFNYKILTDVLKSGSNVTITEISDFSGYSNTLIQQFFENFLHPKEFMQNSEWTGESITTFKELREKALEQKLIFIKEESPVVSLSLIEKGNFAYAVVGSLYRKEIITDEKLKDKALELAE